MPKKHQDLQKKRAIAAVAALTDMVNSYTPPIKQFVDSTLAEHRTLQQQMFGAFMFCIKAWSELDSDHYDVRNEYTVETCKKIMSALGGWHGVPML